MLFVKTRARTVFELNVRSDCCVVWSVVNRRVGVVSYIIKLIMVQCVTHPLRCPLRGATIQSTSASVVM